ncbi:hypothetical protein [Natrialba aegyptia]|uniref:Uncharacterized protein n=1 Tax=Natrialba aegyptia DSM 13077 TaxID=1227491 RepID=M0B7H7_9EURY|nr:hypothetical protein [Natrialba aegyptia]ELZ05579.1 hypothetical protein C480_10375 [Natrialba aegyptia DSM 13077]
MTDDPTVLSRLVRLIRQAGAPSEDSYERDGAFSWHAESHAAGIGIGVAMVAATTGEFRYVSALLAIAFGVNRELAPSDDGIVEDLRSEPHYLIGGLALGLCLGALISR